MNDAEDAVAVLDPVLRDEAADADDVVDLVKGARLLLHLPEDGVDVLGAAHQLDVDAFRTDGVPELLHHLGDVACLIPAPLLQLGLDRLVGLRL